MRTAIHNIPGESGKSNLLQKLVAGVASKRAATVTNGAGPVTREEFNSLTAIVGSLVQDVEDATSPEKLAEVFNAALKPLAESSGPLANGRSRPSLALPADGEGRGARTLANGKRDRGYLAPPGDEEDVGNIMPPLANHSTRQINNQRAAPRPPLALKADRGFLAPKGD